MATASSVLDRSTCELNAGDLERVTAIDRSLTGRTRRRFFEMRFAAARERPECFIHIGVMRGGSLRGFAFARIQSGEFGREQAVAMLDVIGVEPHSQRLGVGQELMEDLVRCARERGVGLLQSQATWTNHSLLRFFEMSGFRLAPRSALERSVAEPLAELTEDV
jgi:GNAT superfamily N-acetyltransferase